MKHTKSLEKLKSLFEAQPGIQLAVVYGSYARKDFTPNSDLDIHIIRNKQLNFKPFVNELKQLFKDQLRHVLPVTQKEKVVLYFKDYPKIEISISNKNQKSTETSKKYEHSHTNMAKMRQSLFIKELFLSLS